MDRVRAWVFRIGLIVGGTLLALVLVEIGLRLFYPQYDCAEFGQADARVGWTLVPHYEEVCVALGHETVTEVKINSLGLRDAEVEVPKPSNTFRILVLGDSMTFGVGVEQDRVFTEVLEELLNENDLTDHQFEVVNAGVPGYGTAQELLFYEDRLRTLQPDIVILAFFVTNDVLDNLCFDGNPRRPCYRIETGAFSASQLPANPDVQVTTGPSLPRFSLDRLHTYVFLRTRLEKLANAQPVVVHVLDRLGIQPKVPLSPLLLSWYESRTANAGWAITSALLEQLKQVVEEEGARLILVVLPGRPQTTAGYLELLEVLYKDQPEAFLFLDDPMRPQRPLKEWGLAHGVAVVDPLPDLREVASEQSVNLPDGHFNATGNAVVGRSLFRALAEQELPGLMSDSAE